MSTPGNGTSGNSFSTKEIVIEIRDAVKDLADKVDRIDRQGSIGTRSQLEDHEHRMRSTEARITSVEDMRVKREEIHAIRNDIAAIRLSLADRPEQVSRLRELEHEVDVLSSWRMRAVGAYALLGFQIPVLATISWHLWG